ncbi:MAG: hypothetical protein J1G01_04440 [Clostridiales bacterium]|nr:hypothetical protein [Clostridiales bacterium]
MADTIGTIECKIENCLTDRDGSLVMLLRANSREKRSVEQILDAMRSGQTEPNKRLTAQFAWHREKRSLNANAYFHVLVGKIAKAIDSGEEEVKKHLVVDYGMQVAIIALPCEVTPQSAGIAYARWLNDFTSPKGIKCAQYAVYKPTHTLDTAEMARLIDGTVSEAQQLGIETKTPAELEQIKQLWVNQKE